MAYIFLSYAKADRKTALVMRDVLTEAGFSVWMDENSLQLPETQWPQVAAIIENAAAFVLLVSDAAQKSSWLKRELDAAEKARKAIFPILIQGKGWSRLQMPITSLGLSINLSLPESFVAELKSVVPSDEIPLPEQIIIQTTEQRTHIQQRWVVIFVLVLMLCAAIAPYVFGQIWGNRAPSHAERVLTNEAVRRIVLTATRESLDATRESRIANQTAVSLTRSADEFSATREARLEASQTQMLLDRTATELQSQPNAASTATSISITATHQATSISITATHQAILNLELDARATVNAASTASSVSITATHRAILRVELNARATTNALGTAAYTGNMSMTAVAGNGVLPCTATVPQTDNLYVLTVYRSPSLNIVPFARSEHSEISLIVREWIINDDGVWYRVGTEANSYIGYVLGESLILDELCPR